VRGRTSIVNGISRRIAWAIVFCLVCGTSGCITVDGTLASDGTGWVTVRYTAPRGATEASQRLLLGSSGLPLESLSIGADRMLSATLSFTDVTDVGDIPVFENTTVAQASQGDDRVVTIVVSKLQKVPGAADVAGPRIRLTLPGDIVEATPGSTIDGEHVEWSFTVADWTARPTQELRARYRPRAS
jgi:hypothetical protein